MSLRQWSVWRIVAVWVGWPLFLAVAVVLPPVPFVPLLALAALGPPALLTVAWLWQRGRNRSRPA